MAEPTGMAVVDELANELQVPEDKEALRDIIESLPGLLTVQHDAFLALSGWMREQDMPGEVAGLLDDLAAEMGGTSDVADQLAEAFRVRCGFWYDAG